MGLKRELALVVLGTVLGSIIPDTSQSLMAFFTNIITHQSLPVDYSLVIAGIGVIVGFGAIGYNLIIESRNRKKKTEITLTNNPNIETPEKTPNEKVDDLIQEMLNFVNKWRYPSGLINGYRFRIEKDALAGDEKEISKIMQYSSNMYTKINLVKNLGVTQINDKLNEMMPSVDNLAGLEADIRETYWSRENSKIILSSDPKVKAGILSNGDKICKQFDLAVYQLQLLRKHLP